MLRCVFTIAGLLLAGSVCAADPPKVADLVRQLEAGPVGERVIATERLGDLGPAAVDAIPALTRTARSARRLSDEGDYESREIRRANKYLYAATINTLVGIGPKSVSALVELLPGEKDDPFGEVSWHIGSFGKDAIPFVPALAKLLADDNQDFRVRVAGILERLGPDAEPAIPQLMALFENPKNKSDGRWASGPLPPPPRVAAVRTLVRIGPKGARCAHRQSAAGAGRGTEDRRRRARRFHDGGVMRARRGGRTAGPCRGRGHPQGQDGP